MSNTRRRAKADAPAEVTPWSGPSRITMEDVAKAAGVSLITVSRALHQPSMVLERTRQRIEEAVRETGYVPNLAARSLQVNRTNIVALLIPTLSNSIFGATAQGVADVLEPNGYQLMVGSLRDDRYTEAEERLVRSFLGRRPDAFILSAASHSDKTRDLLVKSGIPVVSTWKTDEDPIDEAVLVSNFAASRTMVRELAARGYRKIGLITGQYFGNQTVEERRAGYETAVQELGLPSSPNLIVQVPVPLDLDSGAAGIMQLLKHEPDMDAVFCAGDVFAHGALLACANHGIAVPERLGIVGFGDLELSSRIPPGLTTVRIRGYDVGREAAQMVLDRLQGDAGPKRVVDIGYEIVWRGTTRAA